MDWKIAGTAFRRIEAAMIHDENTDLHGDDFYAEALRRLAESGALPVQVREVRTDDHSGCHAALASAERASWEQYEKFSATMITAAASYAEALRLRCTPDRVPSRLRREGVLLAASWLDGGRDDDAGRPDERLQAPRAQRS